MIYSNNYLIRDGKRFDILKFLMSILVVAIHTTPMEFGLRPIFRLAVPLFFILSSYLFFSKQSHVLLKKDEFKGLEKLTWRYLKLYFFWFIILLPITIVVRRWYIDLGYEMLISVVKCFLFSSTFRASWFLMASLIGIVVVWALSKFFSDFWLLLIGSILYLSCCLFSNYYNAIESSSILKAYSIYSSQISDPYNSFPVAFLFVVLGKVLSEKKIFVSNIILLLLISISFLFLYCEYYFIQQFNLCIVDDCYVFSVPLSLFLFMYIGQSNWTIDYDTKKIRKASTIIYCCHCSIASVINFVLPIFFDKSNNVYFFIWFLITLLVSIFVSCLIFKLEHNSHLSLFRYAY